jgi:hypothetical protein
MSSRFQYAFAFFAALSLTALPVPMLAQAQGTESYGQGQAPDRAAEQSQAMQMVAAQARLDNPISSQSIQPGAAFHATLIETVHLKNGSELPRGTRLIGTVTKDAANGGGKVALALRFTQAQFKDGKTVPITATIVNIVSPESGYASETGVRSSTLWDPGTLQVDEVSAVGGADLHSRIGGENSGVFVADKKDEVKLPRASELTLAIGGA